MLESRKKGLAGSKQFLSLDCQEDLKFLKYFRSVRRRRRVERGDEALLGMDQIKGKLGEVVKDVVGGEASVCVERGAHS